jgi:hypothetical protein
LDGGVGSVKIKKYPITAFGCVLPAENLPERRLEGAFWGLQGIADWFCQGVS